MKDNSNKIILDLCGGTGSWAKPYKDAGYRVVTITFPEWDVTKWHLNNGFLVFEGYEDILPIKINEVYGILAAPPCTEFSRAKTTKPRDFKKGLQTIDACLKIIWTCQINGKVKFWALENPMGLLRRYLGRPPFTFEPWWYGDLHSKPTDLWGWFEKPTRKVFDRPVSVERKYPSGNSFFYGSPKCPPAYQHLKLARSDIRAITPPMFAKAFFKVNR